MQAFQWNHCFVTGLADVDEQHHRLVDLINAFGSLVMRDEGVSTAELEAVFAELAHYARFHFTEEEALMEAKGLTPSYIESHRQNHAKFMDEVTHLYSGVTADNRESAKGLLQFLTNWLAYHILGSDQFMARQIASIEAGGNVNDVSLTDAPSQDPATDALLNALNGLFQQVSERNHELVELTKTLEARVAERTQALTERTQALTDANQQLDAIANTDVLTTLPNRRYAMRSLARTWDEAVRVDAPMACIMIDADGFKQVNDTHGHDAGDDVLRALSRQLREAVRTDDIVCRLGGDEFLIICDDTDLCGALKVAEKVRSEVAALRVKAGMGEWVGSVSVGVATRTREMKSMEDLLKAADLGVYAAKRNGRNCVAVAE
jgi:hemerythrin